MKLALAILTTFHVAVCWSQPSIADGEVRATTAIQHCLMEYRRVATEAQRFATVDRANVRVYDDELSILFTHGEVGTFDPRSPDYYSVLGCHVLDAEGVRVIYLSETQRRQLIGDERDLAQIYSRTTPAEENGRALELTFLFKDGAFVFSQGQPYSDRNLYIHNPDLPQ